MKTELSLLLFVVLSAGLASEVFAGTEGKLQFISSKDGTTGPHGPNTGHHCPGIELQWHWRSNINAYGAETKFERMVFINRSGVKFEFKPALAEFSPDCSMFWRYTWRPPTLKSDEHDPEPIFEVRDTTSTKLIIAIAGEFPEWAPDSKAIYYSHPTAMNELFRLSLPDKKPMSIAEAKPFRPCEQRAGDKDTWLPVTWNSSGDIEWTVPISPSDVPSKELEAIKRQGLAPAQRLRLAPKTHEILSSDFIGIDCY